MRDQYAKQIERCRGFYCDRPGIYEIVYDVYYGIQKITRIENYCAIHIEDKMTDLKERKFSFTVTHFVKPPKLIQGTGMIRDILDMV